MANRLQTQFERVVASRDWHPPNHGSFAANHPGQRPGDLVDLDGLPQILWPVHCVQDTPGAAFARQLQTRPAGVDTKTMEVVNKWPTAPGGSPVGMSMDLTRHHLLGRCSAA